MNKNKILVAAGFIVSGMLANTLISDASHHSDEYILKHAGTVIDKARKVQNEIVSANWVAKLAIAKKDIEFLEKRIQPLRGRDKDSIVFDIQNINDNIQELQMHKGFDDEMKKLFRQDVNDEFDGEYDNVYSDEEQAKWLNNAYKEIYQKAMLSKMINQQQRDTLKKALDLANSHDGNTEVIGSEALIEALRALSLKQRNELLNLRVQLEQLNNAVEQDKRRREAAHRQQITYMVADPADEAIMQALKDQGFERKRLTKLPRFSE